MGRSAASWYRNATQPSRFTIKPAPAGFAVPDGQAYGGGEHVRMARALGSGVGMLVREGYVRAVVDSVLALQRHGVRLGLLVRCRPSPRARPFADRRPPVSTSTSTDDGHGRASLEDVLGRASLRVPAPACGDFSPPDGRGRGDGSRGLCVREGGGESDLT
jgi:hypothetical protein